MISDLPKLPLKQVMNKRFFSKQSANDIINYLTSLIPFPAISLIALKRLVTQHTITVPDKAQQSEISRRNIVRVEKLISLIQKYNRLLQKAHILKAKIENPSSSYLKQSSFFWWYSVGRLMSDINTIRDQIPKYISHINIPRCWSPIKTKEFMFIRKGLPIKSQQQFPVYRQTDNKMQPIEKLTRSDFLNKYLPTRKEDFYPIFKKTQKGQYLRDDKTKNKIYDIDMAYNAIVGGDTQIKLQLLSSQQLKNL